MICNIECLCKLIYINIVYAERIKCSGTKYSAAIDSRFYDDSIELCGSLDFNKIN
jgi:hypothetical protein